MLRLDKSAHPCTRQPQLLRPTKSHAISAYSEESLPGKGDGRFRLRIDRDATDAPASTGYHRSAAQHGSRLVNVCVVKA